GLDWSAVFGGDVRRVALPTYPFQRTRFWPRPGTGAFGDVASAGLVSADHPLLGAAVTLAGGDEVVFTSRLSVHTHPWLADHALPGMVLFPGTGFLELAIRAGDQVGCGVIEELTLTAPLVLPSRGGVRVQLRVGAADEADTRSLEVYARGEDESADAPWTLHASGVLAPDPGTDVGGLELADWPPPGATEIPVDGLYERLAEGGFRYGPAFQGLHRVWQRDEQVFAEVTLPESVAADADRFGLHPALLDAALHAVAFTELGRTAGGRLPFSWSSVLLHASGAGTLRMAMSADGPDSVSLVLADGAGEPVASVESLVLRPVGEAAVPAAPTAPDSLFELHWVDTPVPATDPTGQRWAVLGARGPVDQLDATGVTVGTYPDLAAVLASGAPTPDAVLVSLGSEPGEEPAAAVHRLTHEALSLVQAWLAAPGTEESRLVLVTSGAVGEDVSDPAAAAVWGLVRSAQSENPGRLVLADVDGTAESAGVLPAVLASTEAEVLVRAGQVRVPRLRRPAPGATLLPPVDGSAWRLTQAADATLDGMSLVALPEAAGPLAAGQIMVEVRAAGVNFRDVLNALGMYPGEAGLLGQEGAGLVTEVGPGVNDLAVGDRVMGMFPGAFGPVAVADRRMVTRMPAGWSFAQAASVPLVFLTAYYALVDLADLRPDEKVLIHAAAGGVGMAATQLARHLGAEVFATASTGKWGTVLGSGVPADHLASSRTTGFEDRFRDVTGGSGVDVVLDSLAREFVDASLRLLPRGGRFVEMGKTDVRDPGQVAADHPGVAYRAFDLIEAGPDRIGEMLAELVALFDRGVLAPLPVTAWDVRQAPEAFRFVSQARHVGKVVLTVPTAWDPDGTVLVTGGTGGLGAALARHLVTERGVRHLVLASRRGAGADGAEDLRAELTGHGADVTVVACDVADRADVSRLLDAVPVEYPLTAVVHTAGVLDDATVGSLTPGRIDAVLAPKVDAVGHLDELTRGADLATFVVYSSVSGMLGGAGQANYAAANAYLDAWAARRARAGRLAQAVAWGAWANGAGMTAGLTDADLERMARTGLVPLAVPQGLALFDGAVRQPQPVLAAMTVNPTALRDQGPALPPLLSGLAAAATRRTAGTGGSATSLRDQLLPLSEQDRLDTLLTLVRTQAAVALGHSGPEAVAADRPFRDLGFDSLTAVELRNRLNAVTGLRLPATTLFDYPSAEVLAGQLRTQLVGDTAPAPTPEPVAAPATADDPVVIVGMGCRFPGGVDSPEKLWRLVADGTDAVTDFPTDRDWDLDAVYHPDPDHAGTIYTRQGGFLDGMADFDPQFFGISPREALSTDPQQRLLLEVAWETLERAGIDPAAVRGSRVGVFTGTSGQDYVAALASSALVDEGFAGVGNTAAVISGRISYTFGFEGPAVTVDTACSSSLVALHLAAQALQRGECDLAFAGGATVMTTLTTFIGFSRQRGLAPDGRCKAFSDDADGTGWGEGVGLLLVERLSDARAKGHRVLAVVRGSAVNQDGASNGLTAPNGPSQQRVIRQALASGGISADGVDAVEAHGTGTSLGDPIEAQALLATYGQGRDDRQPLFLGSIKSNIGHTQAAAGVAGVIKMVQAMRHGVLPATLNVSEPSSHVDWTTGAVELLRSARDWPEAGRPRRAAVSSFGISGTNAHVILEQAPVAEEPEPEAAPEPVDRMTVWPVSARSGTALRAQAERLAGYLESVPDARPVDVGWSLASTRSPLEHRAVLVGESREELLAGLSALAAGTSASGVVTGSSHSGKTAWVFTGQGAQWAGMGRELHDAFPVFADAVDRVCGEFDGLLDRPLRDVIFEGGALLDQTGFTQPALFAIEVALSELLSSWGLAPDVVAGHSIGEVAAAYVAGVFSLSDACRLVAARGGLMQALPAGGVMLAVAVSEEQIQSWLGDEVSLAGVNGPNAVVVSGGKESVRRVEAHFRAEGVKTSWLRVSHAFHSALMDPMLDEYRRVAESLEFRVPRLPLVSTVTGGLADASVLNDPGYWVSQVREPVRFAPAVESLRSSGVTRFVEVGPDAVLTAMVGQCLDGDEAVTAVPLLRRDKPQVRQILTGLAGTHVSGAGPDWAAVFAGAGARTVDLPTYAFVRDRFWPRPGTGAHGDVTSAGLVSADHPLLGAAVTLAGGDEMVFTSRLSVRTHPWLADHALPGVVLFPGTGFLELAVRAGDQVGCGTVEELTLTAPLVLPPSGGVRVQLRVGAADGAGTRSLEVYARGEDEPADARWVLHASGVLAPGAVRTPDEGIDLAVWPPTGAEPVSVDGLYERLAEGGFAYGPAFQGLRAVWRRDEDVYAEVTLPESVAGDADRFGLHPALLDAVLHAVTYTPVGQSGGGRLPFSWSGVTLHASGAATLRVRMRAVGTDAVSLRLADAAGEPVAEVGSLVLRPVGDAPVAATRTVPDSLFELRWVDPATSVEPAADPQTQRWAVLGADDRDVAGLLGETGAHVEGYADLGALTSAAGQGTTVPEAVFLPCATAADGDPAEAVRAVTHTVLAVVQDWLATDRYAGSRLVVVTSGAVGDDVSDPAAAAVWGLVRSAQSENPGRLVLADVDGTAESVRVLPAVVGSGEAQVMVRAGRVRIPRLGRLRTDGVLAVPAEPAWQLAPAADGTLDGMSLTPCPGVHEPLTAGQVRVEVRAAGVNFRDVLNALGMYPGEAGLLGQEGAGLVSEVGAGVTDLAVGDRVMGMFPGAFGPVVVADRRMVTRMPAGWSFGQAASVPLVFLTAYYGLVDLAGLRSGERVLIHAAAGGVGMAATQLAHHLGAEVFATASAGKWDTVRGLGVADDHLASSRTVAFEERFGQATDGRGVDVVLNSLAREFVDASLRLLPRGGRFVEMGKTDIRDAGRIADDHPGVAYRAFDLIEAGPDRIGEMLAELVALFDRGVLSPLPLTVWDVRQAPEAFRFVSQARHVGKVVLTVPRTWDPDGTVLITGVTGGLGAALAR
ncbi:MAG: SDR family NAD(P)-dependent oxidoreductase, partial [Actinocatenispora sp.]